MAALLAARNSPAPFATNDAVQVMLENDPTIMQFQPSGTTNINQSVSATPVLTGAAENNAFSNAIALVKADEHWINKHWRPALGWSYLVICMFDFLVAPIGWSVFQAAAHGNVTAQWQPLTLQGAGLYHLAMGAFLGVTSFGRTKEKLATISGS